MQTTYFRNVNRGKVEIVLRLLDNLGVEGQIGKLPCHFKLEDVKKL